MADKPPKKSSGPTKANSSHVDKIREAKAKRIKESAAKTKAERDRPKQKYTRKPKKVVPHKEPLIEPSEAEKANGWTAKTLTDYIKSRNVEVFTVAPRITKTNNDYDPYRW